MLNHLLINAFSLNCQFPASLKCLRLLKQSTMQNFTVQEDIRNTQLHTLKQGFFHF